MTRFLAALVPTFLADYIVRQRINQFDMHHQAFWATAPAWANVVVDVGGTIHWGQELDSGSVIDQDRQRMYGGLAILSYRDNAGRTLLEHARRM